MDKYELLDILMFIMRGYKMRDIFNNRVIEKGPNEMYLYDNNNGLQLSHIRLSDYGNRDNTFYCINVVAVKLK